MKIVFQGKIKTGEDILVRYPEIGDVEEMLKYINELSKERTFIRYQGEEETLESENIYLKSRLEAIKNKKAVHLLAFSNNTIIAAADIPVGTTITAEMLTIKRPAKAGLAPKMISTIIGKTAKRNIAADTQLKPEDF